MPQKNQQNLAVITTDIPEQAAAEVIVNEISQYLPHKRVLLLLAGGSAVAIYPLLLEQLNKLGNLQNLTVTVGDERWNLNPAHEQANWRQIQNSGFFGQIGKMGARIYRVLQGKSLAEEAQRFNDFLQQQLELKAKIISVQGIGGDGHTAGIFPADKAEFKNIYQKQGWAIAHNLGKNNYAERITISPKFMAKVNTFVLFAKGLDKLPIFKTLLKLAQTNKREVFEYPALLALKGNCILVTTLEFQLN